MNPARIPVTHCRACKSFQVIDLGISKNYYLANLDQTLRIPYRVCKDCQFIFQGEYVGDEFLNHYYRHSPMLRRKEPTPYEVGQNERQSEFLSRHISLYGRKVLEIGAHAGAFLIHLHQSFNCDAYFEELSEEARMVLSSQPSLTDFRSVTERHSMDLLVVRHVLEHIFDLDHFLDNVKLILRPDGYLFIEVPDWSFFDSHTDPLIFEHLNQFNTYSLIVLLRRLGWQIDAVEKSIHPDDPATPNRVQRLLARRTLLPQLGSDNIADLFKRYAAVNYDAWKHALNRMVLELGENTSIALYPASHLTFEALAESNLRSANIIGMFDIDQKKQGKEIMGIKVFPPDVLKMKAPDMILIFTMGYEREIRESFTAMGLSAKVVSVTELVQNSWKQL
ncbi:MAG: methyltransferase domain-containing protein [Syntrophaceae bacterium]|nr:methyltransferase domain-containing protein [Syntrophaceae bacterium]